MPIHYEQDEEHVVLITIDRPEARNSADMEHFKALREAWDRFAADDQAWVAIITGVEESFFAGADLKKYVPEITKLQKQIAEEGITEINGFRLDDGVRAVLRNVPLYKPVIAAVNGFCTAGGMEMLGGTDIRIACPEAKFAVMEPKRGLFAAKFLHAPLEIRLAKGVLDHAAQCLALRARQGLRLACKVGGQ